MTRGYGKQPRLFAVAFNWANVKLASVLKKMLAWKQIIKFENWNEALKLMECYSNEAQANRNPR